MLEVVCVVGYDWFAVVFEFPKFFSLLVQISSVEPANSSNSTPIPCQETPDCLGVISTWQSRRERYPRLRHRCSKCSAYVSKSRAALGGPYGDELYFREQRQRFLASAEESPASSTDQLPPPPLDHKPIEFIDFAD